jgi:hypothetical protein
MTDAPEKSRRRCFRITPDRCVIAPLALEGFLLLSAWLGWFSFNGHKGWATLIAVASVGVFLLLMFVWFLAALIFRWRFQFSVLSLLVVTLVIAIACRWLATEIEAARKQREGVEWIEKAGGEAIYDYEADPSSSGAPWLGTLLGDDLFADVTDVRLGQSAASDVGLQHLKGLAQLRWLDLDGTGVGDAGLEHLKGLTQLRWLDLDGTGVGDAGLEHLRGLTQLQRLCLEGTKVTAAGVKKLQQALPNCKIFH